MSRLSTIIALYGVATIVMYVLTTAIVPEEFQIVVGVALFGIVPSVAITYAYVQKGREFVLGWQVFYCILEAALYTWLLVILEGIAGAILMSFPLGPNVTFYRVFLRMPMLMRHFFTAFVVAGLLEETLKFLVVNRLLNKSHVLDPRGLVMYGAAAANGFAFYENLMYLSSAAYAAVVLHSRAGAIHTKGAGDEITSPLWPVGPQTPDVAAQDGVGYSAVTSVGAALFQAIQLFEKVSMHDAKQSASAAAAAAVANMGVARAALAIPLHTVCGALTATMLAQKKFLGKDISYFAAITPAVFVHGIYDYVIFVTQSVATENDLTPEAVTALSVLMEFSLVVILVLAFFYARKQYVGFADVPPVDVRAMRDQGLVDDSDCVCCCCGPPPRRAPMENRRAAPLQ